MQSRPEDPESARHRQQERPSPSEGLLTARFWRETADRAIKSAAQAVLIYWAPGDLFNAWNVDWYLTAGIAAGAAMLSTLTSIASAPFGDRSSASAVRLR